MKQVALRAGHWLPVSQVVPVSPLPSAPQAFSRRLSVKSAFSSSYIVDCVRKYYHHSFESSTVASSYLTSQQTRAIMFFEFKTFIPLVLPRTPTTLSPFHLSPIPFLITLFRTLLHSPKSQLFYFQSIPNSFTKTPGGGIALPFSSRNKMKHQTVKSAILSVSCAQRGSSAVRAAESPLYHCRALGEGKTLRGRFNLV